MASGSTVRARSAAPPPAAGDIFEKCELPEKVHQARAAGCFPYFIPIQSQAGPEVTIDGRQLIMLGSNNYLGLTQHPYVIEATVRAVERYGTACTGSRFLNGTLDMHEELERRLAQFLHKPAALVFTTGYQANLGTISALVGRHDVAIIDRADHASIVDGCRLAMGERARFRHNDMADLEEKLAAAGQGQSVLIIVDGVFSMEGDLADLPSIVALKRRYGARLLVDDAHAIGVLGDHGRGTAEHFGVEDYVDLIVGTFSKAFASIGGFVAGDGRVVEYIKHLARPFQFSASMSPGSTAAALASLDIVEQEPQRRAQLWTNARHFQQGLSRLTFDTGHTQSPIIPVLIGDEFRTAGFWRALFDQGVFVNAAVSPAVEPGRELLRTSCMATHTITQLDQALDVMGTVGRQLGILPQV